MEELQLIEINDSNREEISRVEEEIRADIEQYLKPKFQIIVLGATNAGKSTFLNHLLNEVELLNVSEVRETSSMWKIKFTGDGKDTKYEIWEKIIAVDE